MPYPLHEKVYEVVRKHHTHFRADPKTNDPTVKAGINAFALLALQEPNGDTSDVPKAAAAQRNAISGTLNNIKLQSTEHKRLFSTVQNELVRASEALSTKEKVDKHVKDLLTFRKTELKKVHDDLRKSLRDSELQTALAEMALKLGMNSGDATQAVAELVKVRVKPEAQAKPAKPDRQPGRSVKINSSRGFRFRLVTIFHLLPVMTSIAFTIFFWQKSNGEIDWMSLAAQVYSGEFSNVRPFGYTEGDDTPDSPHIQDKSDSSKSELSIDDAVITLRHDGVWAESYRDAWVDFKVTNANKEMLTYFYRFPALGKAWSKCTTNVANDSPNRYSILLDQKYETVEFKVVAEDGTSSAITKKVPKW